MLVVAVFAAICGLNVCTVEADDDEKASPKQTAEALMRQCQGSEGERMPPLAGRDDVLAAAWSIYPQQPVRVRRHFVMYIPVFGKDPAKSPGWPWVTSLAAIKALVDVFVTDKDAMCRSMAAQSLVWGVPDSMVRIHAKELLDAVRRRVGTAPSGTDDAMMLLGKTGSDAARRMLLAWGCAKGVKGDRSRLVRNLALAKLGDTTRELVFIRAFERACDEGKQSRREDVYKAVRLAKKLAYIGQPGSVMALARQFRNPLYYHAGGSDYRHVMSVRYGIVNALGLIWPDEPTFAFPYDKSAGGEKAYVKVEKWLETYTGVKWQVPRPAFNEEGATPEQLCW